MEQLPEQEEPQKRPVGRPKTKDVRNNKAQYFREYYNTTNEDMVCDCGCKYKSYSKRKHLLSKKHLEIMAIISSVKEK
jgi:hypothetical protein